MAETIEELEEQLARVRALKKQRAEGLMSKDTPEYRHAFYRAIVDRDDTSLNAYNQAMQTALNNKLQRDFQAQQNELNRQATMEQLKLQKGITDDENSYQWRKDYQIAKNALNDLEANPKATQKQKDDASAYVKYYEDIGLKKGYLQPSAQAAPVAPAAEPSVPAAAPSVPSAPVAEVPKQVDPSVKWVEDSALIAKAASTANKPSNIAETKDAIKAIEDAQKVLDTYKDKDAFKEQYASQSKALNDRKVFLTKLLKQYDAAARERKRLAKAAKEFANSQGAYGIARTALSKGKYAYPYEGGTIDLPIAAGKNDTIWVDKKYPLVR